MTKYYLLSIYETIAHDYYSGTSYYNEVFKGFDLTAYLDLMLENDHTWLDSHVIMGVHEISSIEYDYLFIKLNAL